MSYAKLRALVEAKFRTDRGEGGQKSDGAGMNLVDYCKVHDLHYPDALAHYQALARAGMPAASTEGDAVSFIVQDRFGSGVI